MPSFRIIGLQVLGKKIFKGFYHIWAWRPSWSCDLDHLYKVLFSLFQGGSTDNLALIVLAVSDEKMFEIVDDDANNDDNNGRHFKRASHLR